MCHSRGSSANIFYKLRCPINLAGDVYENSLCGVCKITCPKTGWFEFCSYGTLELGSSVAGLCRKGKDSKMFNAYKMFMKDVTFLQCPIGLPHRL